MEAPLILNEDLDGTSLAGDARLPSVHINQFKLMYFFLKSKTAYLIMRLSILQLFLIGMIAAGGYARDISAQDLLAKNVSIQIENISLGRALDRLENLAGVRFAYSRSIIPVHAKVSLNASNEKLSTVLDRLLVPLQIEYQPGDGQIILKRTRKVSFSEDPLTPGAATTIGNAEVADSRLTGTVIDDKGDKLPGVSVVLKGTQRGTVTDEEGAYALDIPNENAAGGAPVLIFSFVGYLSQEVAVGSQTNVDVTLKVDSKSLEEVVVVGYGTQSKKNITGSVATVQGSEITRSPQANVSNSFAGRLPGLIANNRSGEPGSDGSSILIRGRATTGNSNPLIVIDGIANAIGGLDRLNPNDIESISVLKDASAAIYGAQAANGVILITTKKGLAGKPRFDYSFNQGFVQPTRLPKFVDAPTYAGILNTIDYYRNPSGGMNQRYSDEEIEKFRNGSDPINYPNTNWVKELMKPVALQNQHNLSVSGGTEKINYFVSAGTLYQDGLYRNGVNKYRQYSVRSNINVNVNDKFSFGIQLATRRENRSYIAGFGASNVFEFLYRTYPTLPAYYPEGKLAAGVEQGKNPIAMATLAGTNNSPTTVSNGILRASYQLPVNGLSVDGFFSADQSFAFTKEMKTNWIVYQYNKTTQQYSTVLGGPAQAQMYESQTNRALLTGNIKLNYVKNFGDHALSSFIAYEQSRETQEFFSASRNNFITTQLPDLSQGGAQPVDYGNSGSSYRTSRRNVFGRLNYNYLGRYLAEIQLRYDGSSVFPPGKRYGFFPGISLGWRVSQEPWFQTGNAINDLKIRASYGELGNDRVNANQFRDNFQVRNGAFSTGNNATNVPLIQYSLLANPNITWEVAKKYNVGINSTFFKKLTFDLDLFFENRTNILASRNVSIPALTGISSSQIPKENIAEVHNRGLETQIQYAGSHNNFSYTLGGNFALAKSEVIFIDEAPNTLDYQRATGMPLGSDLGNPNADLMYRANGVFKTQQELDAYPHVSGAQMGDLKYEDYNGDGKIDAADRIRSEFSNVPQITYGVNLGGGWKNLSLNILLQGQARVAQYVVVEAGEFSSVMQSRAEDAWSPTNQNGNSPRIDSRTGTGVNGSYKNTFWFQNTAFLRLKNVELAYNVPAKIISRIGLGGLRIYTNGFNLLTFTKVKDFDPEGDNGNAFFYPQQKIYNVGVNVTF
ncbi:TonB-dependent receptor [Dyadobacter sp. CY261]|uniref:TonB-dependent receptor n=1 Tax=Dyadobacter sp. CY261 TaxID=2907203 RepID=UPI001F2EF530|nr:TonB-dependent receptor [Dyadobacter sp. CY261]MCF0074076.1 TonB-dependent receptor [Dyadobacter sp. CY261]